MVGHIPLHANLRKLLLFLKLINIIEPVTSWLNGQRLFFFTSPYCPNYCSDDGMLYLRYNNNTDIFVHCKKWSVPKYFYNVDRHIASTFHCFVELAGREMK